MITIKMNLHNTKNLRECFNIIRQRKSLDARETWIYVSLCKCRTLYLFSVIIHILAHQKY